MAEWFGDESSNASGVFAGMNSNVISSGQNS